MKHLKNAINEATRLLELTTADVVVAVRPMTPEEMKREYWPAPATVIELKSGALLYPSQDEEGNGPGAIRGDAQKSVGAGIRKVARGKVTFTNGVTLIAMQDEEGNGPGAWFGYENGKSVGYR